MIKQIKTEKNLVQKMNELKEQGYKVIYSVSKRSIIAEKEKVKC